MMIEQFARFVFYYLRYWYMRENIKRQLLTYQKQLLDQLLMIMTLFANKINNQPFLIVIIACLFLVLFQTQLILSFYYFVIQLQSSRILYEIIEIIYFYQIMEIPLGNIFQVTVNSNKLSTFIDDLNKKIHQQTQRIDQLSKTMNSFIPSFTCKLKTNEEMLTMELQKVRRINQEESNYVRLFLKDMDKKTFSKIDEFQKTINMFNHRINQTRDNLQEDMTIKLSYFQKKIQNVTFAEDIEKKLKKEMDEIKNSQQSFSKKIDQKLKMHELESNRRGTQIRTKFDIDESIQGEIQGRQYSHKCLTLRNPCLSHSRKRLKSHRNATIYQDQDEVDRLVNKLAQLQHRLQLQKQNKQSEKIAQKNIINKVTIQHSIEQANHKTIQLEKNIASKLIKIQDMVINKLGECERNVNRITNKTEIMNEQIGIILRKYQKEKNRLNQVANNIKRMDQKKIDQRVIQNIKNAIKKIDRDMQESMESKLSIEVFDKQKTKITERIRSISELVLEKAQKNEVKKGFAFFQQKIKEIILVLAQQKNFNKDSATKKMPLKCLSCDKQLELNNIDQNQTMQKYLRDSTASTARCSTTKLRKMIRVKNNNPSLNNDC